MSWLFRFCFSPNEEVSDLHLCREVIQYFSQTSFCNGIYHRMFDFVCSLLQHVFHRVVLFICAKEIKCSRWSFTLVRVSDQFSSKHDFFSVLCIIFCVQTERLVWNWTCQTKGGTTESIYEWLCDFWSSHWCHFILVITLSHSCPWSLPTSLNLLYLTIVTVSCFCTFAFYFPDH